MFSNRLAFQLSENDITALLKKKQANGDGIIDLTESNPTQISLPKSAHRFPGDMPYTLKTAYNPEPKGALSARRAISTYYKDRGINIPPEKILLTSSTSEAYALLFKLLCDPADTVLCPAPSYPLFEPLTALEGIRLKSYPSFFSVDKNRWEIDWEELERLWLPSVKALVSVNPNNPTGQYLDRHTFNRLARLCRQNQSAWIIDEVFFDFNLIKQPPYIFHSTELDGTLCFILNGFSKLAGLPHAKLGWIAAFGCESLTETAIQKLAHIADTYLSVHSAIQSAAPYIFQCRHGFKQAIIKRISQNREIVESYISGVQGGRLLPSEGGWSAVVALPSGCDDEKTAVDLLETKNVYVHPGYFYGLNEDACWVLSLLPDVNRFEKGARRIWDYFNPNSA